ncbi:MAG TPA: TonB-dependent receptor plug domain-containing protein, partial [Bryobacteraceae bacterium]
MIKGSRTAVTANANGEFSIEAHNKDVLLVSYVGFQDKQVSVGANTNLNISVARNDKSMDDVVVIGYGTQKRHDVTAAVATMDTRSIQERPITRIDQAMIGQMPGVQVRQQSGMPGTGFTILVRGAGSISAGTEPLYVIDGFPLDISTQNANGGFSATAAA